jgi:hypothetical protein
MNQQFMIDFAEIIRATPTAILEHTVHSVWTNDHRGYDIVLSSGYQVQGYTIVHRHRNGNHKSTYLELGEHRVRLVSWQDGQGYQYWAFQMIDEYHRAVERAKAMPRVFSLIDEYIFGYDGSDLGYKEAQFVHATSRTHFAFIWREDQIFPDLWKSKKKSGPTGNEDEERGGNETGDRE